MEDEREGKIGERIQEKELERVRERIRDTESGEGEGEGCRRATESEGEKRP